MKMPTPLEAGVSGVTRVTANANLLITLGIEHVAPVKTSVYTRCNLAASCNAKSPALPCWPVPRTMDVNANRGFGARCWGVGER